MLKIPVTDSVRIYNCFQAVVAVAAERVAFGNSAWNEPDGLVDFASFFVSG